MDWWLDSQNMNSRTENKNQRKKNNVLCSSTPSFTKIKEIISTPVGPIAAVCLPLLINVCKLPRVALQDSSWQEFAVTVWCFCHITSKCRRKQHEDDESEICTEPTSPSEISIWSHCCLTLKSLRWNVFLGWEAGRAPQHHLILVFLCLSFSRKNEEENSSRNKLFFLSFIGLNLYKWVSCRSITQYHSRWQEWPPAHRKVSRAALPQIFWPCSHLNPEQELLWCRQ